MNGHLRFLFFAPPLVVTFSYLCFGILYLPLISGEERFHAASYFFGLATVFLATSAILFLFLAGWPKSPLGYLIFASNFIWVYFVKVFLYGPTFGTI